MYVSSGVDIQTFKAAAAKLSRTKACKKVEGKPQDRRPKASQIRRAIQNGQAHGGWLCGRHRETSNFVRISQGSRCTVAEEILRNQRGK